MVNSKNSQIKIKVLGFSLLKINQGQFSISGIAKTREALVSFVDDLKSKIEYANAESPISDFAKSSDIPFTVTIKINI